ncbi:M15 family metallopeptidase [Actinotalea sp.]|uniref:M15 family metallopeptidase n=1 Tax=Actinotalea sp. TaxID=1872145 RepID=UPI002CCE187D|nr:M15 family metallopeptidase [Actinotalea sp.]HQY34306.1 M15 family metallopeptidase [Actinotalea sp.]HRA50562.1 M15 family metallopeptidase [Actinotalea sp.]
MTHLAPRAAILLALVTATVVVPLVGGQDAPAVAATVGAPAAGYPSAVDVLAVGGAATTPTSLLAAVPGAVRTADTVSRSLVRSPLPDCDGATQLDAPNGQIATSDLCTLWDGTQMLRGDAALAISELNDSFSVVFGRDLCITDSYRTLAEQRRLAYTKPGLAATPGTSNHGWGLAVDLCGVETNSQAVQDWLRANGPVFGWDNPQWARAGGSGAYEPWHWEYVPGTTAQGTNWDTH